MLIKNIKVSNFKSFDELCIELNNFNVVIGTNASGKSNFVTVFKFLGDIFNYGLDNAVSMQGGREYLRNVNIGNEKELSISLEIVPSEEREIVTMSSKKIGNNNIGFIANKINYDFSLYFYKGKRKDYKVVNENLIIDGEIYSILLPDNSEQEFKEELLGNASFKVIRKKDIINESIVHSIKEFNTDYFEWNFYSALVKSEIKKINKKRLFIETFQLPMISDKIKEYFKGINVYNIDPSLSKNVVKIEGKNILESDGNNLSLVLKKILENKEDKIFFSTLIKDILPFTDDLTIEKFADKLMIASLKEIYSSKTYFPASLLSDGTINIIAMIIILYFEDKQLIIVEEPGRCMHPLLSSKLIDFMKETSKEKQIIITTHNPEFLKYVDISNIYYIKRNDKGYSQINNITELDEIKDLLKFDMGIDHIHIKNLFK